MKFKVGDRVRAINKVDGVDLIGKCGTVVGVKDGLWSVRLGVEFDEPFPDGHDGNGRGKRGHCRFGYVCDFELIQNQKIVITADGRETLARLYEGNKVIKSATAKCNPEDTFDFKVGAKLAFDRLVGVAKVTKEPRFFKGKAVCVKSNLRNLTVGKIYDFSQNNGCGECDDGIKILSFPCASVGELNARFFGNPEFLEIKE